MTKIVELRGIDDDREVDIYQQAVDKITKAFTESTEILNDLDVRENNNRHVLDVYAHIITTILINITWTFAKDEGPLHFHYSLARIMHTIAEMLNESTKQLFPSDEEKH